MASSSIVLAGRGKSLQLCIVVLIDKLMYKTADIKTRQAKHMCGDFFYNSFLDLVDGLYWWSSFLFIDRNIDEMPYACAIASSIQKNRYICFNKFI